MRRHLTRQCLAGAAGGVEFVELALQVGGLGVFGPRMQLVPDGWEDPRDTSIDQLDGDSG
jgi:hypothetical protein